MECKITSTTNRSAFTLVELFVAIAIGFVVLGAVGTLAVYSTRSFAAIGNYMELDKNSRNALDRMTQIVREADGVLGYTNHALNLSYHGQQISFNYSPNAKTLSMTETNGAVRTLLTGCEYLSFEVFQRNSIAGTYDQYPVTLDESVAKIVQVTWICSKHLAGSLLNSESVQSAKIVIRKQ